MLQSILASRRDVRGNRFTNKPIANDTINTIIKAGLAAPSVGFSQPWRFVVIRSEETKRQIKASFDEENRRGEAAFEGGQQALYKAMKLEGIIEAPVNIAVFYQPAAGPVLGQTSMSQSGKYSVVCAIQNMWLMARTLEVGFGWVSIVDPEKVKQVLNAPEESELIGYLCLGYVDAFGTQPELEEKGWDTRRPWDEVVISEFFEQR